MFSTRVSRHVKAARAEVYRALLDRRAVKAWRVPNGMTSEVHDFDPREGATFRVSLSYDVANDVGKTSTHTDTYHGHFAKLVPDELVVETIEFETSIPEFRGVMTMTTALRDAEGGTDVVVQHEGLPAAVSSADNEAGTQMALANLATLLEAGSNR
ncbi:MAG: hypothetical protein QOK30_307 [Nocardioidaceae bacterium]|jgi:uncharacterized protein YndB with AHSA1/START domain|nr:hypothetical protein [Nocardioidaceae bacterium]